MGQVVKNYTLPAAGGTPVVIRCTRISSRMEIQENAATPDGLQGLIGQRLTPTQFGNYTVGDTFEIPPSQSLEPYVVAGYPGDHPPHTVPIGNGGSGGQPVAPGGPATLGTPIVQLTSAGGSPTVVAVTESF